MEEKSIFWLTLNLEEKMKFIIKDIDPIES